MSINKPKENGYEVFKISNLQNKIIHEVETDATSEVDKGNRFCSWILKYMFERTQEEIDSFTEIAGKDDNSVDAWYEENNRLYIVQAKYNTAHSWKSISQFILDLEKLLKDPFDVIGKNDKLYDLANIIEQYMEEKKEIELYYITNSNLTSSEKEKIEYHKKNLESNFENLKLNLFGIDEIKDYLEMELNSLPARYRGKETRLLLKNKFVSDTTCVAEVALKDFANFVKENIDYLFYSNVRNFLKSTSVNKSISKTFQEKPTDFWFYNNGVTIVCDKFELNQTKDFILKIITPQIVNGCQTANTIFNEWRKLKKEEKTNLQGTILIKIIQDPNGIRRDNITRYTNNQNAVSGKDFYALDDFQKKLKKEFKELGYYYEIQRKSSLTLSSSEIKKYKGNATYKYLFAKNFNNIIPVKEVVQAYAAGMHLIPSTAASRSGELAPYAEHWSKLFNSNTPEDPYHFLFPYGVMQYGKNYLGYDSKKGQGFRKNCLMLFITTYFKLLVFVLKRIDKFNILENVDPLKIELSILKNIFENEKINKILLKTTDDILQFYMRDNTIKKLYDDNLPKFLKSAVQSNATALETMINHIQDSLDEMPLEELNIIKNGLKY